MLVLSRKVNESIIIDNDIQVTIVDVRGNHLDGYHVKLGIAAPRDMPIDRQEVYDRNNGHRIR